MSSLRIPDPWDESKEINLRLVLREFC
jgi:hypothetical protein